MRQTLWICGIAFLLFTGLSGCSSISAPESTPTSAPWKERLTSLSRIQDWNVNGKIAVQTTNDSGSATIDWAQRNSRFNIALSAPLGAGGLTLTGQPGLVTLIMSDGKRYTAKSPEQLLAERWGWQLPVSNLNYWIRGLPSPRSTYNGHFDMYNRLSSLEQDGWSIQYLGYTNVGSIELPNRITMSSAALKTKVVIHHWRLG